MKSNAEYKQEGHRAESEGSEKRMPGNRHITGVRGPSPDVGKRIQYQKGQSGNPGDRLESWLQSEAHRGEVANQDGRRRT